MKRAAIFNDTRRDRHYGCDLVMAELQRHLEQRGVAVGPTYPVSVDWRKSRSLPRRGDVDLLVVNGEGSIHHADTRPRAVYLSELGRYAREELGVPAFLINATIADINDTVAANLKAFDRIYVREPDSAATLSGFGLASTVVPDLTVTASFPARDARAPAASVCATDSVLPASSEAIQRLSMERHWPYRGMRWRPQWWQRVVGVSARRRAAGLADFVAFLGAHSLVVTGRFHTVTMCIGMQVPFVAVESNTYKISSFVSHALGSSRRVVPVEDLAQLDLSAFAPYSSDELKVLSSRLPEFRQARDRMFDVVAGVVPM